MKDDFEIIRRTVPSAETVTIYPVADVHLGAAECDEREWVYTRSIACVATTSRQRFGGYAAQKMLQPRQTATADHPMLLRLSGRDSAKHVEVVW